MGDFLMDGFFREDVVHDDGVHVPGEAVSCEVGRGRGRGGVRRDGNEEVNAGGNTPQGGCSGGFFRDYKVVGEDTDGVLLSSGGSSGSGGGNKHVFAPVLNDGGRALEGAGNVGGVGGSRSRRGDLEVDARRLKKKRGGGARRGG